MDLFRAHLCLGGLYDMIPRQGISATYTLQQESMLGFDRMSAVLILFYSSCLYPIIGFSLRAGLTERGFHCLYLVSLSSMVWDV